tara:strand:- start:24650 stop:25423 length:774 start_codon:yes stop_codon:yes gene_type:complete
MNLKAQFNEEIKNNIKSLSSDRYIKKLSKKWILESAKHKWSYNFSWMGRPAIQFPNDTWAMQEIIWEVKPDLIIETGIAHGGSLIFYASMLALLDLNEFGKNKKNFQHSNRKVLGIDIDIRNHNKKEIENHAMFNWIAMIEGSSIDKNIVSRVKKFSMNYKNILVVLDSNHTHEHVLEELKFYAPLVSKNSYCVVFDTIVNDMPAYLSKNRPWGPDNNPKTALDEFLKQNEDFVIDKNIDYKLQISVAPNGFLKKVK